MIFWLNFYDKKYLSIFHLWASGTKKHNVLFFQGLSRAKSATASTSWSWCPSWWCRRWQSGESGRSGARRRLWTTSSLRRVSWRSSSSSSLPSTSSLDSSFRKAARRRTSGWPTTWALACWPSSSCRSRSSSPTRRCRIPPNAGWRHWLISNVLSHSDTPSKHFSESKILSSQSSSKSIGRKNFGPVCKHSICLQSFHRQSICLRSTC